MKKIIFGCLLCLLIGTNLTAIAQNTYGLAKLDGQKNIGVAYVRFDTSTKLYFNAIGYKDYAKIIDEPFAEKNTKKWGKYTYNPFPETGRKPNSSNLDYALTKVLKQSGFIDTVNQIFTNEGNMVYLQPIIGEENYYRVYEVPDPENKKKKINIYSCKIDVNWRIANAYGEILDSVAITTISSIFDSTSFFSLSMTEKFFTTALKQLFEEKKLAKYFAQNNTVIKPNASTLEKPKLIITKALEANQACVIVKTPKGHGSGFAITNNGYIITNYHVISTENPNQVDEITVILDDGTKVKAAFIKANKDRDIALLKVEKNFEKCFQIPTSKNFKTFEEVYTIGAPKSIELGQSASKGILSSERNVNNVNLLQVSMNINSGNSGGPMFTNSGELIGVVSAKLFGFGIEGVAFGIPAYKINDYLNVVFQ